MDYTFSFSDLEEEDFLCLSGGLSRWTLSIPAEEMNFRTSDGAEHKSQYLESNSNSDNHFSNNNNTCKPHGICVRRSGRKLEGSSRNLKRMC